MVDLLRRWFAWPPSYDSDGLRADITSGLTVAVLLLPQAMAYALLAGVPPVYGIYAAIVPVLVYSLLSSSPHISVGPTALASILTLTSLGEISEPGSADYLTYCFLLAGLTGLVQLTLGVFRLGSIINFLSRPVISGFVSAAAVLILFSQLKGLLGLSFPRQQRFHDHLWQLVQAIPSAHLLTVGVGLFSLLAMLLLSRWRPKWPLTLIFIVLTTAVTAIFRLDQGGLSVLGAVPNGLPAFHIFGFTTSDLLLLLPAALVLGMVSFIETLSIGKTLQEKHNYYRTNANRELVALGASKLIGSFFQAIPTSASFSRSAIGEQSGAKTVLSSLVTVVLLVISALFLVRWFFYLPIAVLSAVIILSVRKLLDLQEMRRLWKLDKREWLTLMVTFLVTLFGGLQFGIAAGVLLSLSFVLLKSTKPHLAELGRLPGTNAFRNLDRFSGLETSPSILIVRFDAELYFGNADYFRERLTQLINKKGQELSLLILDAHTIHDLDTSGAYALNGVIDYLAQRNAELYLAGTIGPVRDQLYRFGIMDRIGSDHQFLSIQSALFHYEKRHSAGDDWDRPAVQHDLK